MTILNNAKGYDWPTWFLGIMRSFISGGSSAMVSGMAGMGIAPDKFNLSDHFGNVMKLMGAMFLFQGGYRMFEFLQLHGAPDQLQQSLNIAADANIKAGAAIADAKAQTLEPKQ